MKTVQLVQFREDCEFTNDYGFSPDTLDFYRLIDEEYEEEIELDDDDGNTTWEHHPALLIEVLEFRLAGGMRKRKRVVMKEQSNLNYNKLTIELDDESDLFRR